MPEKQTVPALTNLQFLVLGVLRANEQPGRVIREALLQYGVRRTGPAFYQLMSRLESARLVDGRYEQITVGDQAVTERWYRITPDGTLQWQRAQKFYTDVGQLAARLRWSNA